MMQHKGEIKKARRTVYQQHCHPRKLIIAIFNTSTNKAASIILSTQQHKPPTKSRRRPKLGIQGTYDRSDTSLGMVMKSTIQQDHCRPQTSTLFKLLAVNPERNRVSFPTTTPNRTPRCPSNSQFDTDKNEMTRSKTNNTTHFYLMQQTQTIQQLQEAQFKILHVVQFNAASRVNRRLLVLESRLPNR